MKKFTSYSVRIKHYSHIFKDTVNLYRSAVDRLIEMCLNEWEDIVVLSLSYSQHNERISTK